MSAECATLYVHLDPSVRALADQDDLTRAVHMLKNIYIRYRQLRRLEQFIEYLMRRPKSYRPAGAFLKATSGMGKTQFLRFMQQLYSGKNALAGPGRTLPVLYVEVPAGVTHEGFIAALMHAAGVTRGWRSKHDVPLELFAQVLQTLETRLIFIDEVQNLISRFDKDTILLDTLREMSNRTRLPSMLAGNDEFLEAYQDFSIASRWPFVIELPVFSQGPDFESLMLAWQRALPLRLPSNLATKKMCAAILAESGGIMDLIAHCLSAAAIAAIRLKRECITEDLLTWWRDPPVLSGIDDDATAIAGALLADERTHPDPLSIFMFQKRHYRSALTHAKR